MVEIVAAEIVDHRPICARCHERVDVDAFVHEHRGAAGRLVAVVAADHAFPGLGIVRLADPRQQQHAHVVERECCDQHKFRGLLELTP